MTVWLEPPQPTVHRPSAFWAWWLSVTRPAPLLPGSRGDLSMDRRRGGPALGARASDVEWAARWLPSQPAVLPPLHPREMPTPRPARKAEGASRNRRAAWRPDRRVRDCGSPYRVERRSGGADRRAALVEIAGPRVVVGRFNG